MRCATADERVVECGSGGGDGRVMMMLLLLLLLLLLVMILLLIDGGRVGGVIRFEEQRLRADAATARGCGRGEGLIGVVGRRRRRR